MNTKMKAGLATAALAVAAFASSADAADLGGGYGKRGSIKDAPMPAHAYQAPRGPAGPCYFRGDLGYSVSKDPSVKWPVTNSVGTFDSVGAANAGATGTYDAATNVYTPGVADPIDPNNFYSVVSNYLGDTVSATHMDNAFFGGVGLGCGMGSRGIRGEVMLGYTGHRKIHGEPLTYNPTPELGIAPPPPYDDPLHTGIKSTTLMFNGYKDFGNWGGITPYVGAGVGVSYNKMSEVYFTDNPALTNRIEGDSRLSLAWSLMAGIGWQVSDRAILDLGYRYMDYGKAQSGRVDSAGFINPAVRAEDLSAHEFKVGLRYHFGSNCCEAVGYQPMK
jgi:opacity protein-like surface antigen